MYDVILLQAVKQPDLNRHMHCGYQKPAVALQHHSSESNDARKTFYDDSHREVHRSKSDIVSEDNCT
jgi:hypothetical protein